MGAAINAHRHASSAVTKHVDRRKPARAIGAPRTDPGSGAPPTPSVRLSIVQARAKPIAYNNGYRLYMASGLLNLPEVRDVTEAVRRAAEA